MFDSKASNSQLDQIYSNILIKRKLTEQIPQTNQITGLVQISISNIFPLKNESRENVD